RIRRPAAPRGRRGGRTSPDGRTTCDERHGFEGFHMKSKRQQRVLVSGGAGFLGSHLCERLIEAGAQVTCLDNFLTGREANLHRLKGEAAFELVEADIVDPLPAKLAKRRFD